MKTLKYISVVCFITLATSYTVLNAQSTTKSKKEIKKENVKDLVDAQKFVFVPNMMIPLRGSSRQLTSYNDLRISMDTIISYLPYFGRAYSAPINPNDNGFDFTSTNFEYTKKENRKGGWDILIKPKDQPNNVQQMSLQVYENGSASLSITSVNRDPISYEGYVREYPHKK